MNGRMPNIFTFIITSFVPVWHCRAQIRTILLYMRYKKFLENKMLDKFVDSYSKVSLPTRWNK